MVAVLCVSRRSVYKGIPGVECYDQARDAFNFHGGMPVVAHPPCAQWSRLFRFSRADVLARVLAMHCVTMVQENGGVLEHPAFSRLFGFVGLPRPGESDRFGRTIGVSQYWFGHQAAKPTWLYVCGSSVEEIPFVMGYPEVTVSKSRKRSRREIVRSGREATPAAFAFWLLDIAAKAARTERVREVEVERSWWHSL